MLDGWIMDQAAASVKEENHHLEIFNAKKKIYSYSVVYANIKHTFIQIRKKKKKPILWHYYYENLSDFLGVIIVFYISMKYNTG